MARIILEPRGPDAGFYRQRYELLLLDLEAAGHEVVFEPRPETRSLDPLDVGRDLIIHLMEHLEDEALGGLVALVLLRLRGWKIGRKGESRNAVIYGPAGEVLREFDLPGDD